MGKIEKSIEELENRLDDKRELVSGKLEVVDKRIGPLEKSHDELSKKLTEADEKFEKRVKALEDLKEKLNIYLTIIVIVAGLLGLSGTFIYSAVKDVNAKVKGLSSQLDKTEEKNKKLQKQIAEQEQLVKNAAQQALKEVAGEIPTLKEEIEKSKTLLSNHMKKAETLLSVHEKETKDKIDQATNKIGGLHEKILDSEDRFEKEVKEQMEPTILTINNKQKTVVDFITNRQNDALDKIETSRGNAINDIQEKQKVALDSLTTSRKSAKSELELYGIRVANELKKEVDDKIEQWFEPKKADLLADFSVQMNKIVDGASNEFKKSANKFIESEKQTFASKRKAGVDKINSAVEQGIGSLKNEKTNIINGIREAAASLNVP